MAPSTDGCHTCYGTGEVVTELGPSNCPDCYGDGKQASAGNKFEWRLRELERSYRAKNGESLSDVMWLVHELRQARNALVLILTRSQDADESDDVAKYVRRRAMEALGLYPRVPSESTREKA